MHKFVALSGSNGWVGRALVQQLSRASDAPYSITGVPRSAEELSNIACSDASAFSSRHFVHLAALVHQMAGHPTLAQYRTANRDLTIAFAQQAALLGFAQFIFVSTAKVMGEYSEKPWTEADPPNPQDPYAQSKLEAEQALLDLAHAGKLANMQLTILRPPLIYGTGARANYERLLRLADSPLSRWPIPIPLGGATAPRSLLSLERLTGVIKTLIDRYTELDPTETFFVADLTDTSAAQLLANAYATNNRPNRLVTVPAGAMKAASRLTGQQAIYDRLFRPLQIDSSRLNRFLKG